MDGVSSLLQNDAKALNASIRIIAAPANVAGFVWAFFVAYSDPNSLLGFCRRVLESLPLAPACLFEVRGFS
jgi:hypothetical protein